MTIERSSLFEKASERASGHPAARFVSSGFEASGDSSTSNERARSLAATCARCANTMRTICRPARADRKQVGGRDLSRGYMQTLVAGSPNWSTSVASSKRRFQLLPIWPLSLKRMGMNETHRISAAQNRPVKSVQDHSAAAAAEWKQMSKIIVAFAERARLPARISRGDQAQPFAIFLLSSFTWPTLRPTQTKKNTRRRDKPSAVRCISGILARATIRKQRRPDWPLRFAVLVAKFALP